MEPIRAFREEYFFLSNFYPCTITYDGLTYQNPEAAFQAAKVMSKEERIPFTTMNPSEAKQAGRRVSLRPDWEQIKRSVMTEIERCKYDQHPDLLERLLATKDAYLEEGNTWGDRVWGTVNGQGANLLGHILMTYRAEKQLELALQQGQEELELD